MKRLLRGENVVIGIGAHAKIGDGIAGIVLAQPLAHVEALELNVVSEHLIILGVGYVGLEFAQAMRPFCSKATMIGRKYVAAQGNGIF